MSVEDRGHAARQELAVLAATTVPPPFERVLERARYRRRASIAGVAVLATVAAVLVAVTQPRDAGHTRVAISPGHSTTTGAPASATTSAPSTTSSTSTSLVAGSTPFDRGWTRVPVEPKTQADGTWLPAPLASGATGPHGIVAFATTTISACCQGSDGWFSPDGLHWQPMPDSAIFAPANNGGPLVTAFPGGFVAMGTEMTTVDTATSTALYKVHEWLSPDGLHWSPVPLDPVMSGTSTSPNTLGAVVTALGVFGHTVIAAINTGGVPSSTGIWRSTDGRHWQGSFSNPGFSRSSISTFVTVRSVLVAMGEIIGSPAAWTSTDAITWRASPAPGDAGASFGDAAGPRLLMLGHGNGPVTAVFSDDGIHWDQQPTIGLVGTPRLLGAAAGEFLASECNSSVQLCASADGIHWQPVSDHAGVFAGNQWGAVFPEVLIAAPDGRPILFGGVSIQPGNTAFYQPTVWIWSPNNH